MTKLTSALMGIALLLSMSVSAFAAQDCCHKGADCCKNGACCAKKHIKK
jgi:hypothetical protein